MKIIFFEDDYKNPLNINFRKYIEKEIDGVTLDFAAKVKRFEDHLNKEIYDIFILDVMAPENLTNEQGRLIDKIDIGLELLNRLNNNYYPNQKDNPLVFIRSARARDYTFISACKRMNATYIFPPGEKDFKIVDIIKNYIEEGGEKIDS